MTFTNFVESCCAFVKIVSLKDYKKFPIKIYFVVFVANKLSKSFKKILSSIFQEKFAIAIFSFQLLHLNKLSTH